MSFRHGFLFASLLGGALLLSGESVAGLKWTAPAGWKNLGSQTMRAATYNVPAVAGDKDSAECVVYFFGQGQGGPIQANLDRWKSQFQTPDGKPSPAKIATRTVNGLAVTTIDVAGNYSGMGGPLATSASVAKDYRLLGAILVNPGGNIFLKFTGPAKTVTANQQKFEQLLASFSKQ
ncbi:MAG TPA: hypothetical protein VN841_10605 [Bryobacteraceae bacterium]|nr:hypothetical protein [Bryobacteraceae bacterium]